MTSPSSARSGTASLYGFNLLELIAGFEDHMGSAHELAAYVATHGLRYPAEKIGHTLGVYDRAAFELFRANPEIPVAAQPPSPDGGLTLALSINTLGRLHIRPLAAALPEYAEGDQWLTVGHVQLSAAQESALQGQVAEARAAEATAFRKVQRAMDVIHAERALGKVLEEVIDHVQHVESVCFYVEDRFFALIDRYVNLIDTKKSSGYLPALRGKDYLQWSDEEILIVTALHTLFMAGKAVKFEEFNGCVLSARSLLSRLSGILMGYRRVGATTTDFADADPFAVAAEIHRLAMSSVAKPWLRYRWIYGPTFQKNEEFLQAPSSTEARDVYLADFEDLHHELVGRRDLSAVPESLFFMQLATACLSRDIAGLACERGSSAVCDWIEHLMERIVASAVVATDSDYGMSSSLRDLSRLVDYDREALLASVHALTAADFYTCFVSRNFTGSYERDVADTIASSVQHRMTFNRWHFFPGNFERSAISDARHWYYPPLVPDIAIFSNMHRAAHSRALVKYSIRAPGPDMSRPPLQIAQQAYRGFYDIRVVRMDGDRGYTTEEMLRARRRTLWLEAVFAVLVAHLQSASPAPFAIKGFQRGAYLDLPGDNKKAA